MLMVLQSRPLIGSEQVEFGRFAFLFVLDGFELSYCFFLYLVFFF